MKKNANATARNKSGLAQLLVPLIASAVVAVL